MLEWLAAILLGPVLWLAGAIVFDGVHWWLHRMLRSRWGVLRALARPHAVHHAWIDRNLVTHFDRRRANVLCHIVPEYLTQLAFTALLAWFLPTPFVVVLAGLQTLVFLGVLSRGGLALNHRPAPRIDAHPPGWLTPPAYHALHHAFPDAHFSSYTKTVDRIVGGGAQIAGRRFAWRGPATAFGAALRAEVERCGGRSVEGPEAADADVQVLLDGRAPLAPAVEATIEATRDRQLPPEIWALRAEVADPRARHYRDDVRVCFRAILEPQGAADVADARRHARRALFWIRRDAHFVAPGEGVGWRALRRFLSTRAEAPPGVVPVRHRMKLPGAAATAGTTDMTGTAG